MSSSLNKALASKGWTAIAFPSSEFGLFTLVFERSGARGHSNDFEYLAPGVSSRLLPPDPINQLPNLTGDRSSDRSLSVGVSILSGLISALGGGTLGLKAAFSKAESLSFTYADLSAVAISEVGLQMGLNRHPLPVGGLLRDWLDDHLYVATAVLFAKTVSVKAGDKNGREIGLDVPVIKGAVGAKVDVKAKNENNSEISLSGDVGVPIALRLYQVVKGKVGGQPRLTLRTIKQGGPEILAATPDDGLSSEAVPVLDLDDIGLQGSDQPYPIVFDWEPE